MFNFEELSNENSETEREILVEERKLKPFSLPEAVDNPLKFTPGQILAIMSCPIYTGIIKEIPAIIDEETWIECQVANIKRFGPELVMRAQLDSIASFFEHMWFSCEDGPPEEGYDDSEPRSQLSDVEEAILRFKFDEEHIKEFDSSLFQKLKSLSVPDPAGLFQNFRMPLVLWAQEYATDILNTSGDCFKEYIDFKLPPQTEYTSNISGAFSEGFLLGIIFGRTEKYVIGPNFPEWPGPLDAEE